MQFRYAETSREARMRTGCIFENRPMQYLQGKFWTVQWQNTQYSDVMPSDTILKMLTGTLTKLDGYIYAFHSVLVTGVKQSLLGLLVLSRNDGNTPVESNKSSDLRQKNVQFTLIIRIPESLYHWHVHLHHICKPLCVTTTTSCRPPSPPSRNNRLDIHRNDVNGQGLATGYHREPKLIHINDILRCI